MALAIGTAVEMTRDAPYEEYNVRKGDIGVITYVASTGKYSISIYGKRNPNNDNNRKYGNDGDFWIPFEYVRQYDYQPGDRVEIVNKGSKYYEYKATVKYAYGREVYLYVDETNYKPKIHEWEHDKCLKLITNSIRLINEEKGKENMAKLTGFKNVVVINCNGVDYHYALYDENIKVGDNVLVSGRLESCILTVKDVITLDEAKERFKKDICEEVKCKVDLSDYEQRINDRKKASELKKKMDEEIKKMDELNKYEMYADRNPALAKMLEELKALGV